MERWKKGGREEGDREEMMDGWMDRRREGRVERQWMDGDSIHRRGHITCHFFFFLCSD